MTDTTATQDVPAPTEAAATKTRADKILVAASVAAGTFAIGSAIVLLYWLDSSMPPDESIWGAVADALFTLLAG